MHILKLNATDSTNQYLKDLSFAKTVEDFTVVWAYEQLKGRGQIGATWQSEPGKNLTFSVLKYNSALTIHNQFLLNICASLAILDALSSLSIPNLSVKWPNDILSGNAKICGILIENICKGNQIQSSIVGIGLNVNQVIFSNLTNVASLKLLLGKTFNLEEILYAILNHLKNTFSILEAGDSSVLWDAYEQRLFRKDKPSTFKDANGGIFMGFIRKITPQGKLIVELEDAFFKAFDLKELQLLY